MERGWPCSLRRARATWSHAEKCGLDYNEETGEPTVVHVCAPHAYKFLCSSEDISTYLEILHISEEAFFYKTRQLTQRAGLDVHALEEEAKAISNAFAFQMRLPF